MWRAVIMATGLYMLVGSTTIAYVPINVPHPAGPCQQEQELSKAVQQRIAMTPLGGVPHMLLAENLATDNPRHDWCAPRTQIRGTVPGWDRTPLVGSLAPQVRLEAHGRRTPPARFAGLRHTPLPPVRPKNGDNR